jgi:hypothetical protein
VLVKRPGQTHILAMIRFIAALSVLALVSSPAAAQSAPRVRITEDLRLDANAENFSAVGLIYVGPRREIIVPLRQDMQIRMYDSTGKRIAAVGRRGSGPGEFQSIGQTGWIADTLWTYDLQQRRFTLISPAGVVLRTIPLGANRSGPQGNARTAGELEYFIPYVLNADGSIVGEGRFHQESKPGAYVWAEARIVHSPAVGEMRTLAKSPEYQNGPWYMTVEIFGNPVPFAPLPQTVFSLDGKRFALFTVDLKGREGGTYTIQMFRTTGQVIFNKTFPYTGLPIPQRVVDSTLAAMIPPGGRALEGPADMPQRFQAIAKQKMPPVYPPVQAVIPSYDNTTWVVLRRTPEGQTAIVLNARGEPVGSVAVPPRSRILQGSATHVWMTETDADGLVSVVRYKLSGVGCAPPECR